MQVSQTFNTPEWTPKKRTAYVSRHLKAWCAEVLGATPGEITIRSGSSRHRSTRSLFIVNVDANGHASHKISFEVKFSQNDAAPRYSTALTRDPATGQWHPLDTGGAPRQSSPVSPPATLSRKLAAVLLVVTLLIVIPASWKGIKLTASVVEGLWAYTWRTVDGDLNEVGYRYRFKQQDESGQPGDYTSPFLTPTAGCVATGSSAMRSCATCGANRSLNATPCKFT